MCLLRCTWSGGETRLSAGWSTVSRDRGPWGYRYYSGAHRDAMGNARPERSDAHPELFRKAVAQGDRGIQFQRSAAANPQPFSNPRSRTREAELGDEARDGDGLSVGSPLSGWTDVGDRVAPGDTAQLADQRGGTTTRRSNRLPVKAGLVFHRGTTRGRSVIEKDRHCRRREPFAFERALS